MKTVTERIYSKNNSFQRLEVLKRNRQKRQQYQEFLVEGVRSLVQAQKQGWEFVSIAYSKERPLSDWAQKMIADCGAPLRLELQFELMQELSEKEETSELVAVLRMPKEGLSRIKMQRGDLLLVFDRPNNPGNLGSSIRSADALGVRGVVVTGHATDLYHPHTIRGSMGSFFSMPVVRLDSHAELSSWLEVVRSELADLRIVGTSERAEFRIDQYDFSQTTVLLMGNETFGLSANYKSLCDSTLNIPMLGTASSLNVSCATTVFLYERLRQRLNA